MEDKPRGLRWQADGPLTARLRPRISRLYVCLGAAAWNIALGSPLRGWWVRATSSLVPEPDALSPPNGSWVTSWPLYEFAGLVGGIVFLLLALRELLLVTDVRFDAQRFVVRSAAAPWVRLDIPVSEIDDFHVVPQRDGTHTVEVRMCSGAAKRVPLHFETVPLHASWTRKRLLAVPVGYASFLAVQLHEMLEAARRLGHDNYRA